MKRLLVILLALITVAGSFTACGNKTPSTDDTKAPEQTQAPAQTEKDPQPERPKVNPADFDFFEEFKAPEGTDYRKMVVDEMRRMASIPWTPAETFTITLKESRSDMGVNLECEAGKTYYGVPYGSTACSSDIFSCYLDGNVFTPNSTYYETITGNNCSTSMCIAYQYAFNFPIRGGTYRPCDFRGDALKFCGDIVAPEGDASGYFDSEDLWKANSRDVIMNAFAQLKPGDILYHSIRNASGHTRMVAAEPEIAKKSNGDINYSRSYITVIESTNLFNSERNSNWWVDKKYTFTDLYEAKFMPSTLTAFDSGAKLEDAYIAYKGKTSAETMSLGYNGTISSNFPLTYVRMVIKDANGNIAKKKDIIGLENVYSVSLQKYSMDEEISTSGLASGTYTFTLTAGIARGTSEILNFNFTIN